jgi:hypothetical protein
LRNFFSRIKYFKVIRNYIIFEVLKRRSFSLTKNSQNIKIKNERKKTLDSKNEKKFSELKNEKFITFYV